MSSLLLSLPSRPFLRNLALKCHHTLRMFSSSTTTNPYLMYRLTHYGSSFDDINVTSNIHYFDPVKEDEVIVRDKAFPMELRNTSLVGMSHGWGVFNVESDEHKALYVSDYCNPCGSKSNPKVIPLHPMGQPNITQKRIITNAGMTYSPDQSKHFVVAANCLGLEINFFRPCGKPEYSGSGGFKTQSHYFDQSKVMYSKRDEKFYTPSVGGHFLAFWDSCFEEIMTCPKMKELRFCNLPELTQSEWELLDSCSPPTAHLAESPSGQRFLIKWYAQNYQPGKIMTFLCRGTKRFMVFREEEDTNMCYTEDIGDLCIFLGGSEPFCVKASSFPGLKPNSIYFAGEGFGVYDIATRKPRSFRPKSPSAFSKTPVFPLWIPPMSL
ncbi:uncharacterized protein LOC9316349 [Arabidopsis lyrata subsp. lyrata]|uniref:uncharacterized protein LOC9316349 n=1 Tax=Arabidopsis lyrata subsp. lyrata TaxID=81972 RepID=UPI000A29DE5F|nr:uncharacterized protein LOC9316349 [Arabidopsis lyrata subsp. lyrata]|eukprot:XP_020882927.1 uncharacterized protein LOC9316349 [Arabidopsis lyrata subsp. lyrata]